MNFLRGCRNVAKTSEIDFFAQYQAMDDGVMEYRSDGVTGYRPPPVLLGSFWILNVGTSLAPALGQACRWDDDRREKANRENTGADAQI